MKFTLLALCLAQLSTFSQSHPVLQERQSAPIALGLASTFGVVAATTITSTGSTVVTGDIGVSPGTAITGFGTGTPGVVTGNTNAANTAASNAEAAILTAYNDAAGLVSTDTLPVTDLGGLTLGPGVYDFSTSSAVLSTTLTLNGTGDTSSQFIFQIDTTFETSATTSEVVLIDGAQASNVYFIVGSSATLAAGTQLQGNVLAYTSISVDSAVSVNGTLGALNGAVTLIDDAILAEPTS